MASMKRPRLCSAEPLGDHRLTLTFVDGRSYTLDFGPLLAASPGLAPLRDPAIFAEVRVILGEGWALVWPTPDIQIGADTLWLDVQAQQAPDENTRTFVQWRARNGLSLAQAAAALGLTTRTLSAYGTGARPVPRYIALACKGWDAERQGKRGVLPFAPEVGNKGKSQDLPCDGGDIHLGPDHEPTVEGPLSHGFPDLFYEPIPEGADLLLMG